MGTAEVLDYTQSQEADQGSEEGVCEEIWNPEVEGPDEVTESTISERSFFDAHPVLVNSRMKRKTIKEVLNHYRRSNETTE